MKRLNVISLIGCVLCLLLASCTPSPKNSDRYVVVLSMDGFRSDYPTRAHTPTLDSLAKVGVKAAFRPCYPSVTFPNHYSMATGLHPDHHGIVNNSFYDAELDSVYTMKCSDPRFFGGEPIWNTAERQGVRAGVCMRRGRDSVTVSGPAVGVDNAGQQSGGIVSGKGYCTLNLVADGASVWIDGQMAHYEFKHDD